jgi:hypothetical protein
MWQLKKVLIMHWKLEICLLKKKIRERAFIRMKLRLMIYSQLLGWKFNRKILSDRFKRWLLAKLKARECMLKLEKKQRLVKKSSTSILRDKANKMLLMLIMKSKDRLMNYKWPKINLLILPIQKDFQESSQNFEFYQII